MAKASSQKFTQRNRPARVEIEYEVELYGAEKEINLPFVMGVMADLSGKQETGDEVAASARTSRGTIPDRKFLEIDIDNFDERMKAMKPRTTFRVPNKLTGEGEMSVDLTFESMDDFSPAAVARKIAPLNQLLTARTQLANLLTYMDGKDKAEKLIAEALQNPALLQSLASAPNPDQPQGEPQEGDKTDG